MKLYVFTSGQELIDQVVVIFDAFPVDPTLQSSSCHVFRHWGRYEQAVNYNVDYMHNLLL
jgi:hypothetical protein